MESLQPDFSKQVETYLAYFELINANIVEPLIERTNESRSIRGYDKKIDFVRNLISKLGKNNQTDYKTVFFLQGMNGMLRNALVHNNYYIKDKNLIYYRTNPWKQKVEFREMPLSEFTRLSGFTFFQRLIFNIICGLRFGNVSLEQVKELSSKKIIKMASHDKKE